MGLVPWYFDVPPYQAQLSTLGFQRFQGHRFTYACLPRIVFRRPARSARKKHDSVTFRGSAGDGVSGLTRSPHWITMPARWYGPAGGLSVCRSGRHEQRADPKRVKSSHGLGCPG